MELRYYCTKTAEVSAKFINRTMEFGPIYSSHYHSANYSPSMSTHWDVLYIRLLDGSSFIQYTKTMKRCIALCTEMVVSVGIQCPNSTVRFIGMKPLQFATTVWSGCCWCSKQRFVMAIGCNQGELVHSVILVVISSKIFHISVQYCKLQRNI